MRQTHVHSQVLAQTHFSGPSPGPTYPVGQWRLSESRAAKKSCGGFPALVSRLARSAPWERWPGLSPHPPDPPLPLHTHTHLQATPHAPDPRLPAEPPFLRSTLDATCTHSPHAPPSTSSAHTTSSVPPPPLESVTHSPRCPDWLSRDLEGAWRREETW